MCRHRKAEERITNKKHVSVMSATLSPDPILPPHEATSFPYRPLSLVSSKDFFLPPQKLGRVMHRA